MASSESTANSESTTSSESIVTFTVPMARNALISMNQVTQILEQINSGDESAASELLPLVYEELRKLASHKISLERPGHTLQATALVHEAFLRLAGESRSEPWRGRRQFFAAAAEAMRRILVESARRKNSLKRGGQVDRKAFHLDLIEIKRPADEILALHDALKEFAQEYPAKAELVKLRYFVGMTITEAAEILGISPSSIDRQWSFARAWLHQHLKESPNSKDP